MPNPGHTSRRHDPHPPGSLLPFSVCSRPARKSVCFGVADGPPHQHSSRPWKNGQRAPAACPKDGRSEEGECPTPDTPPHDQGPPWPHGHTTVGAQDLEPGRETRRLGHPPPHTLDRQSTKPEQETRRGTDRLERPYQRPAPVPREAPASGTQPGGARTPRRRARTHTHNRHTAHIGRATGPSLRNAQTALNDAPAGEGKRQPDGATCNTHREGREERGKQGEGKRQPAPAPSPLMYREGCAYTDTTLHPPRQEWCRAPGTSPGARLPRRRPMWVPLATSQ